MRSSLVRSRKPTATPVPRARTGPQEPGVRPSEGALRRQGCSDGRKAFHHPDVGDLTLGYQSMQLEGTPGHRLVAYYAEPGTPEHNALVLPDMAAGERTSNGAAPNSRPSATTPDGAVSPSPWPRTSTEQPRPAADHVRRP
ncbi:hypothetical protein [Streptomyces sp. NPDC001820]|uniref:MmyB family transcriptional regulator n=1 Tax=Streptomyces sp. NPDC001820 TaxID=3364613 RepID=UPI003675E18B